MRHHNHLTTLAMAGFLASTSVAGRAQAQGENPSFRLINRRDIAIAEVYATPSGFENWGRNRLDKTTLAPQAERVFKIPTNGNCFYDLKVVFADKKVREKHHENLCKFSNLPVE
jgi:hypothetical protein